MPKYADLRIRYNDLNNTGYSELILHDSKRPNDRLPSFIYKVHTSKKINRIINLPFKHIWKKRKIVFPYIAERFSNSNPLCFLIYARYFHFLEEHRKSFLEYLREKYNNCKIVLYFSDLQSNYDINVQANELTFDAIISFDKQDALQNNFLYYGEQPFSTCNIKRDPLLPQNDVSFVGKAKERLGEIITVFELLNDNGLTCDFHIVGAQASEQKYSKYINYHNYSIDYYRLLQHVISTKCILEIVQRDGKSHTPRISEAIYYGKKILSNCQELMKKPFYNPEYISIYSDPQKVDIEFIRSDISHIDYNYKQHLSPLRLINFIDSHFSQIGHY